MDNTGRRTILVVDDDASILALAGQVLESRGYEVLAANDSASALRIAVDHPSPIHLLLTDVMMPQGNGLALAKAFEALRPGTPVLLMSGFEPATIELMRDGDATKSPLLAKPFAPRQLLEQVQALVPLTELSEAWLRPSSAPSAERMRSPEVQAARPQAPEAVYRLESPAKCPHCGATISALKAIRLLRTQVNFVSTLPRRGRIVVCTECLVILPAELTNF